MASGTTSLLVLLAIAASARTALAQCPSKNISGTGLTPSPPSCASLTAEYTASLRAQYVPSNRASLGVGVVSSGSTYVPGDPKMITVAGIGNNDHVAYANCCRQCEAMPGCTLYTLNIDSCSSSASSGSTTVKYRCNLWTTWCLGKLTPVGAVTVYPAAFARPLPPALPDSNCVDDAVAPPVGQCPPAWATKIISPNDDGEVAPQFQGATAANFIELGNGAVVKGRLVSSTSSNPSILAEVPGLSAQQCVQETWTRGGEFFTWESCSYKCSIFQNNACNGLQNGVENGFTPSETAFSAWIRRG